MKRLLRQIARTVAVFLFTQSVSRSPLGDVNMKQSIIRFIRNEDADMVERGVRRVTAW
jgi:hypothetical protein